MLRSEREHYEYFESQFKGFSPTVQIHKLPGGAMGSSFEQAVKGEFLDKMLSQHRKGKHDHRLYLWNQWVLDSFLAR